MLTAMGRRPLPWQRDALDLALEFDPRTGLYVHKTVLMHVPRRGGKSVSNSGILHHRAMTIPRGRAWYTAQTGADASEWFREEHIPILEDATLFSRRWRKRMPNGKEQVTWLHNQGTVRVFAPTPEAMHSKDSDVVVLDECWAHDALRGAQLLQGIGPTQATRPGAQIIMISASGDETSTFWIEQLTIAREAVADGDPSYALIEYGVPDDQDATDPDIAARYHPAVGRTIDPAYLHTERRRLGAAGFARAYGCRQVMPSADRRRIDVDAWLKAGDVDPVPLAAQAAVAFDVSPERRCSLVAAVQLPDGRTKLDVIAAGAASADVVQRTVTAHRAGGAAVGVDDYGPARDVADAVHQAQVPLYRLTSGEYAAACSRFVDRFNAGQIVHRGDPQLNAAVAAAVTRNIGDGGFGWSRRRSDDDISALVAATIADWTLDHAPAAPFIV